MKISTTITKKFFDLKMQDLTSTGQFFEYKECKPFWEKRLEKFKANELTEIVFLVGSEPHRFKVEYIYKTYSKDIPKQYRDAIKTIYAYVIKCVPFVEQRG